VQGVAIKFPKWFNEAYHVALDYFVRIMSVHIATFTCCSFKSNVSFVKVGADIRVMGLYLFLKNGQ
jgi:hypothetical protein